METIGGDGSKTELVMKKGKHKSTTGIGASLTLDYREKEESKNMPDPTVSVCVIVILGPLVFSNLK